MFRNSMVPTKACSKLSKHVHSYLLNNSKEEVLSNNCFLQTDSQQKSALFTSFSYLIGDEFFPSKDYLVRLYPGTDTDQAIFNYRVNRAKRVIVHTLLLYMQHVRDCSEN